VSEAGSGSQRADERVPLRTLAPLAVQHLLVMISGPISSAFLLTGALHLTPEAGANLLAALFLMSGIGTALQSLGPWRIGARMPFVMLPGGAAVALFIQIAQAAGPATAVGAVLITGLFLLVAAPLFAALMRFFPAVVLGSMIIVIGLNLIKITAGLLVDTSAALSAFSPAGTTVTPLLTDGSGNALSVIYNFGDGREYLTQTFDSNQFLTHDLVLAYGLVSWVTRGLFLGEYHVFATQSVDDFFINDAEWIPEIVRHDADESRRQPALRHERVRGIVGDLADRMRRAHVLSQVEVMHAGRFRRRSDGHGKVIRHCVEECVKALQRGTQCIRIGGINTAGRNTLRFKQVECVSIAVENDDLVVTGFTQQSSNALANQAGADEGYFHVYLLGGGREANLRPPV